MKLWDKKTPVAVLIAVIAIIAGLVMYTNQKSTKTAEPTSKSASPTTQSQAPPTTPQDTFLDPKKSAHYESNAPEHGSVLAGVPINVVIDFNFDLARGSTMQIIKDGEGGLDYGLGEIVIDKNKLSMRREMDQSAPDSKYTVSYSACWADGSCHDGNFQFQIDRSKVLEFTDLTEKKAVTLAMQNFSFNPAKIKVSKGTKVTWVNKDSVIHTVNTDSHPAHTYYLNQNSKDLKQGDSYSVTFNEAGVYLYHCTPHAGSMHGQILVE